MRPGISLRPRPEPTHIMFMIPHVYCTEMDVNEPAETSTQEPCRFTRGLVESLDLTCFHPDTLIGEFLDGF